MLHAHSRRQRAFFGPFANGRSSDSGFIGERETEEPGARRRALDHREFKLDATESRGREREDSVGFAG